MYKTKNKGIRFNFKLHLHIAYLCVRYLCKYSMKTKDTGCIYSTQQSSTVDICFIDTELNVTHLILNTTITIITITTITHNTPLTQAKQDGLKKQLERTESLEKKLLRQL